MRTAIEQVQAVIQELSGPLARKGAGGFFRTRSQADSMKQSYVALLRDLNAEEFDHLFAPDPLDLEYDSLVVKSMFDGDVDADFEILVIESLFA